MVRCRIIFLLVLLFGGCNSSTDTNSDNDGTTYDARAEVSGSAASNDIAFTNRVLTVHGATLALPTSLQSLTEIIGEPNRTSNKANIVYIWDDLGIVAYKNPAADKLHSIAVQFLNQGFDFSPNTNFTGKIILANGIVDSNSTVADLQSVGLDRDADLPFLYVSHQPPYTVIVEAPDSIQGLSIDWSN